MFEPTVSNTLKRFIGLILSLSVVSVATSLRAVELTENLIQDGGMEEWTTTEPQRGEWNYLTVSCKGTEFGRNEKGYILPGLGDAGDRLFGV